VVRRVGAERVGHADDDGALRGELAQPLHRDRAARIVAHLLEIADHQNWTVG